MLVNSVIDLIGNTPLVKINNIDTFGNKIYIKLEGSNPGRSTKDRIALKMIEEGEKAGLIDKDTVIMEATSGNTGIGLAMICAVKNYKLKIVMPDTMSVERIQLMRAYGTEVILTDGSLGMKACLEKLEELKKKEKKYFIPDQFTNVNNPKAHYETTAEEILKDLNNKVDVFICGTGTGGSFSGTAKKLKERLPNIKTFPVEPASSPLLSKGYIGPHKIQGMGMSIGGIPAVYDGSLADGILTCEDDDAFKMMRELSFKEGILAGISTGATLKAALDYSKENANKNLKIVILSTDSGEKYLSNICEL
ncbi:cysteine synthase A [Fusobacterium animalis]|uniref:cysteine synthase A n=1 Tax=Fusobacterium TaxID=848 RepID=UPI0003387942|nr:MULTISPECIES: cysteine synthase A [Fusobacterium]MCL4584140.1 cysteine synthase [Fusobacterium nucleatum YWH7054]CDA07138.1 cysteine synthase [Fusobacterium sp. CAG:649]